MPTYKPNYLPAPSAGGAAAGGGTPMPPPRRPQRPPPSQRLAGQGAEADALRGVLRPRPVRGQNRGGAPSVPAGYTRPQDLPAAPPPPPPPAARARAPYVNPAYGLGGAAQRSINQQNGYAPAPTGGLSNGMWNQNQGGHYVAGPMNSRQWVPD